MVVFDKQKTVLRALSLNCNIQSFLRAWLENLYHNILLLQDFHKIYYNVHRIIFYFILKTHAKIFKKLLIYYKKRFDNY